MTVTPWMVNRIAQVCHEANRAVQVIANDPNINQAWPIVSEEMRESAREGVRAVLEADRTPAEMHALWSESKLLSGWVYGPVKDEMAKTHPCLVPYEDLDEGQRLKDRVFIHIITAFQEHADAEGLFGL